MHAAIKIISFLVFGAAISTGNGEVLLAGILLVVPLYFFSEKKQHRSAILMVKRLKWLFISILVVYLFFTPGQLLLPGVLWGPTLEGLLQGIFRITALVILVAAVNLLITGTEQEEFLSAILWCLRPISVFGFSHERLAVRITLTLEVVSQARNKLSSDSSTTTINNGGPRLSAITGTASRLFESTLASAESEPLREITLPEETSPPAWQWLIPLVLAILFPLVHNLNMSGFV